MKKAMLDFVLRDDSSRKIVFRFYPKASHMHSFDDKPPMSLQDVYKVYYSWGIVQAWKHENGSRTGYQRIFYMSCDECSVLEYLEYAIRNIIRYKKRRTSLLSLGQPGSMWTIMYYPHRVQDEDTGEWHIDPTNGVLAFEVFDNWTNLGYKFDLELSEALDFCDYLHDVNQHMLENGEPI